MTNTVNVPREALELFDRAMRDADISFYHAARQTLHSLLAAPPKAEPKVIGMIGHVSSGRSELSAIVAALSAQPEAPKVEQEPDAGTKLAKAFWGIDLVPSSPGPASDELLERIHSWLVCAPMVSDVTEYHEMAAQFAEEIAKHKGPQS